MPPTLHLQVRLLDLLILGQDDELEHGNELELVDGLEFGTR